MKTIAATALTVALGLGSFAAAAAPAGAKATKDPATVAPSGPSAQREIMLGSGSCVWGAFSILGNHIIILERCEWEEEDDD